MNCFHTKRSALFFACSSLREGRETRSRIAGRRKKVAFPHALEHGTTLVLEGDAGRQEHSQGQPVLSYCWLLCKRLTQPGGINLSPRDTDFTIKDLRLSSSVESSQDSLPRKITFCYTQLNLHKTHLNVDSDHLV